MRVDDDSDDDVPLSQLGCNAVTKDAKLRYQLVAEKATNLVRLAQSDPAALGSLFNLLDQLAGRLRNGYSIDVQAYNTVVPLGNENPGSVPLLGTLRAAPNTYNQRCKISRHENRRKIVAKKRSASVSNMGQSRDSDFLPEPRTKKKACSIRKCPGHQCGSCPKIHKYNKPPLDMNKDMISRHELSSALAKVGRYKTDFLPTNDT
jgi:hypothetical protein